MDLAWPIGDHNENGLGGPCTPSGRPRLLSVIHPCHQPKGSATPLGKEGVGKGLRVKGS